MNGYDYRVVTFGPEVRRDLGALLSMVREDGRPLVRCYADALSVLCRAWDTAGIRRTWYA